MTHTPLEVRAVADPTIDPLTPGGVALLAFVDAVLSGGDVASTAAAVKAELGAAGLVDAAAVIGNFQMMNRVADGTGIPVGRGSRIRNAALIDQLGLDRFDHTDEENTHP